MAMKAVITVSIIAWVLVSAALTGCFQDEDQGKCTLRFAWGDQGPPAQEAHPDGLWIWVRVEQQSSQDEDIGTVVAESSVTSYRFDGQPNIVDLTSVPNGSGYVALVELLDGPLKPPEGHALYYGISDPFELAAGKLVDVTVSFGPLRASPSAVSGSGLVIVGSRPGLTEDDLYINTPIVQLRFQAERASSVVAANDTNFTVGRQELILAQSCEGVEHCCAAHDDAYFCPWNLNTGLCREDDEGESPADGDAVETDGEGTGDACGDGPRVVFLRLVDDQGYEAKPLSTQVNLDTQPPVEEEISSLDLTVAKRTIRFIFAVNGADEMWVEGCADTCLEEEDTVTAGFEACTDRPDCLPAVHEWTPYHTVGWAYITNTEIYKVRVKYRDTGVSTSLKLV
jgi:hypothetical protein